MMQQSKPGIAGVHDNQNLFRASAERRHRTLILPKYLEEASFQIKNRTDEIAGAHAIFLRWAELESNNQLTGNETTLDDSFRQEIFSKALGYLSSTSSPNVFYYQKGFHIPGSGPPDGVLGNFPPVGASTIRVCLELKSASTDLDHDKFNGRTPVKQCWDYLNNLPDCPWGIVSNFVSFRLYHRDKTQQAFEHFELQKLRDPDTFARFFTLFQRGGLLANHVVKVSRAEELLRRTDTRQREVGGKLLRFYEDQSVRLTEHLRHHYGQSLDQARRTTETIFNRVIFTAFCASHGLIAPGILSRCAYQIPPCTRATNPCWRNFLDLFEALRVGHPSLGINGGFRHPLFDACEADFLELSDLWALVLREFCAVDFRTEVDPRLISSFFREANDAITCELAGA